jgi:hypothetical protein
MAIVGGFDMQLKLALLVTTSPHPPKSATEWRIFPVYNPLWLLDTFSQLPCSRFTECGSFMVGNSEH